MDLTTFNFPVITKRDIAFSTLRTDKNLLAEAKERGFYNGNTPYNRLFSNLFYNGGTVKFKKGANEEFQQKVWAYCRALMNSFETKPEEKEAICAMLMSELIEPEMEAQK